MDLKLDLETVPLSRRGNWMSLSRPVREHHRPLGPGIYLRSNHARGIARRELFLMDMQVAGEPVAPSLETGPGYLRLSGPEGAEMELVFTDGEGVLIRGSGCSLRLTAVPGDNSTAYALEPGCWVFNLRASLRRYRVELFSGAGELEQTLAATETNFESGRMVLTLDSGDGEGFECALDAFWSAWEPVERRSFGETVEAVRSEFAAFVAGMPPVDPSRAAAARRL